MPAIIGVAILVSWFGNKFSATDRALDLLSGLGPEERLGVLLPFGDEPRNRLLQLGDAVATAPPDGLLGDHGPTLNQIEPRGTGRSEVEMTARMRGQLPRRKGKDCANTASASPSIAVVPDRLAVRSCALGAGISAIAL
jgi:hypothetical protein